MPVAWCAMPASVSYLGGKSNLLRPRLLGYFAFLILMIGLFSWGVVSRPLVTADVERDRGIYRFTGEGNIENSYVLKLTNKDTSPKHLVVEAFGLKGAVNNGLEGVVLEAGETVQMPLSVVVPPSSVKAGANEIVFEVSIPNAADKVIFETSTFLGPPKY